MIVAPGDPLRLAGAAGLARTGARERFDPLKRQRSYFKSSPQAQPAAAAPETFRARAARRGGYGTAVTGTVAFNP